jgi:hypothetical protein
MKKKCFEKMFILSKRNDNKGKGRVESFAKRSPIAAVLVSLGYVGLWCLITCLCVIFLLLRKHQDLTGSVLEAYIYP